MMFWRREKIYHAESYDRTMENVAILPDHAPYLFAAFNIDHIQFSANNGWYCNTEYEWVK